MGVFSTWFTMTLINGDRSHFKAEVRPVNRVNGLPRELIVTVQDMTLDRLAVEEILLAKRRAEEATAAKSLFLSTMSHEIRTPMNAVIGLTDILLMEKPRTDQLEFLQALQFSGRHLLSLLNDVLDFSKIDAGRIEFESAPFRLRQTIREAFRIHENTAKSKNIEFRFEVDHATPDLLLGDAMRFNQVLANLLGNALKFTHEGSVNLWVRPLETEADHVRLRFEIKDTGIGIPEEHLPTIFTAFTQGNRETTRLFGGTGLGLSISKKLVEIQGGAIGVDSITEKGSTFWFELPFGLVVVDESANKINGEVVPPTLEGLRVLLVEDNKVNKMVVRKLLSNWEAKTMEASHGGEALGVLALESVDVILMDLEMPVMDGFEATKQIRALADPVRSHTPIVALTASSESSVRDAVLAQGMNGYLTKPINADALLACLMRYKQPV
jgi:signal transduction histidine kinase